MENQNASGSRAQDRYTVVVGIDFEEPGNHALAEAVRLAARRPDAEFHIVHVITDVPADGRDSATMTRAATALDETPRRLRAYLAERLAGATTSGESLRFSIHSRFGAPADAILQLAVDVDAALIIVGTHGRRGVRKLALGSVAERLVQIARCPLLIARPTDYAGLAKSAVAEPVCPECAKTRAATGGATAWCEYHSRPQFRPHTYGYSETYATGGHDPGIVPT